MNQHFLQGIDTIILRVSDIDEAKLWYTSKLGLKKIYEDEKIRLVVLDTFSPTSLTLWETDEKIAPNPKTVSYPIFKTLNAKDAHNALKQLDVTTNDIITDHVVTYFTFFDPDGNMLEVCQVHD
jgi:catechol 2,3-dioxygenase-like lactoylglutathione lyase family enzyme